MSRRNRNRRQLSNVRNIANRPSRGPLAPPPFDSTIFYTKKFRFQASSALSSTNITVLDLLSLLVVADTTVSASTINTSIRLRKVEMWGPMASSLAPVTVSCEFPAMAALLSGPNRVYSDTSMGSTFGAHVKAVPTDEMIQYHWQTTTSGAIMFQLNGPSNTIVDVTLDCVLQNGQAPITVTVVAASVGTLYCRSLDSQGSALLVPVSYVTI